MRNYIIAVLCILIGSITSVWAQDNVSQNEHVWQLKRISGTAWIEVEGQEPVEVKRNQEFNPGETLRTDERTRIMLTRGKEKIQVGSNASITLPGLEELEPGKTVIRQNKGTLHLSVEKKNVKHFSVQTPYMVAAVKGTEFSVNVFESSAGVKVHEGLVEVANTTNDQVEFVGAGQSVSFKITKSADGKGIGNVSMAFIDRGEVHPDIVAERARQRVKNEAWRNAGFFGFMFGWINDKITSGLAYIVALVDATVATISDITSGIMSAIFGEVVESSDVKGWVSLFLIAIATGLVIGIGAAYIAVRRKNA